MLCVCGKKLYAKQAVSGLSSPIAELVVLVHYFLTFPHLTGTKLYENFGSFWESHITKPMHFLALGGGHVGKNSSAVG